MIEYSGLEVGIVLSSDWRHGHSVDQIIDLFFQHAFSHKIIDKTSDKEKRNDIDVYRGRRIRQWLDTHRKFDVEHFIILDDHRYDIPFVHPAHFIHCQEGTFSYKNLLEAIDNLNSALQIRLFEPGAHTPGHQLLDKMRLAVQTGDLATIQELKDKEPTLLHEKDACGHHSLLWAARNGQVDVVRFLIREGVDLHVASVVKYHRHCSSLHWAIKARSCDVAMILIDEGGAFDAASGDMNMQPIHLAAREGLVPILKKLLEKGRHLLEAKDLYGRTPLVWAAMRGQEEALNYLIAEGADVHVKMHSSITPILNGWSALFCAIKEKQKNTANILITHNVPIQEVWEKASEIGDSKTAEHIFICLGDAQFFSRLPVLQGERDSQFFADVCLTLIKSGDLNDKMYQERLMDSMITANKTGMHALLHVGTINRFQLASYKYQFTVLAITQLIREATDPLRVVQMIQSLFQVEQEEPFISKRGQYQISLSGWSWQGKEVSETWITLVRKAKIKILELTRQSTAELNSDIQQFLNRPTSRFERFFKETNEHKQYMRALSQKDGSPEVLGNTPTSHRMSEV